MPELKVGEWQYTKDFSAIWIHVPDETLTDRWLPGLVRLPISLTGSDNPPVWKWDGNKEAPTLSPSIAVTGVWHGYLRNGKLETC